MYVINFTINRLLLNLFLVFDDDSVVVLPRELKIIWAILKILNKLKPHNSIINNVEGILNKFQDFLFLNLIVNIFTGKFMYFFYSMNIFVFKFNPLIIYSLNNFDNISVLLVTFTKNGIMNFSNFSRHWQPFQACIHNFVSRIRVVNMIQGFLLVSN